MSKKLSVTLIIEVNELPEEQREEIRADFGDSDAFEEGEIDEMFDVESYGAHEIAECVTGAFYEESVREMFAGSNIYVTFSENVEVANAEWIA